VTELVGHDRADSGGFGGALELVAKRSRGDPSSVVGEEELDEVSTPWVTQRPTGRAMLDDPVDQ
jgi:hypothetical protein